MGVSMDIFFDFDRFLGGFTNSRSTIKGCPMKQGHTLTNLCGAGVSSAGLQEWTSNLGFELAPTV